MSPLKRVDTCILLSLFLLLLSTASESKHGPDSSRRSGRLLCRCFLLLRLLSRGWEVVCLINRRHTHWHWRHLWLRCRRSFGVLRLVLSRSSKQCSLADRASESSSLLLLALGIAFHEFLLESSSNILALVLGKLAAHVFRIAHCKVLKEGHKVVENTVLLGRVIEGLDGDEVLRLFGNGLRLVINHNDSLKRTVEVREVLDVLTVLVHSGLAEELGLHDARGVKAVHERFKKEAVAACEEHNLIEHSESVQEVVSTRTLRSTPAMARVPLQVAKCVLKVQDQGHRLRHTSGKGVRREVRKKLVANGVREGLHRCLNLVTGPIHSISKRGALVDILHEPLVGIRVKCEEGTDSSHTTKTQKPAKGACSTLGVAKESLVLLTALGCELLSNLAVLRGLGRGRRRSSAQRTLCAGNLTTGGSPRERNDGAQHGGDDISALISVYV
mmetsp:Transcript_22106/g.43511  ORF Transcript_22106/g.43511 Transcript_22106/m.43511 type:complete len:443 (-) Transcript_22106:179-1507(-)